MNTLNINDVTEYVERNISFFHQKRLQGLDGLTLKKVLKRKNPYLYKAKNVITAEQIVRGLLDAHVSSNEETVFGDWLEGLAIFVCSHVHMGKKSGIVGIDLEMNKDNVRYIIAIKSGPNWGNSSQISKMQEDFKRAIKTLRTSNSQMQIIAINGCCYGRDSNPDKGSYFKYCGQRFWEFISASETLYTDIIEPLGWKAKERNDEFNNSYVKIINQFTKAFLDEFARKDGSIDWIKLVQFNSAHIS
jgi:hypothetical protein